MGRRVVVTGIGLICGVGNTTEQVWKALLAGQSGVQRITGFEEWTFGDDGLVAESLGHFDQAEYDRQLEHGTAGST